MYAREQLNRLGLDQSADERAIKRAYARHLKQIDQQADAHGFQLLRHAYEVALDWVRQQPESAPAAPPAAADPAAEPAPAPAPSAYAPAVQVVVKPVLAKPGPAAAPELRDANLGEDPDALAQAVYADFLVSCRTMGEPGMGDSLQWSKRLKHSAGDDRLLNLAARARFEFCIARLLAEGWQPGHDALFIAARQVFGWEKDRRRLIQFGDAGDWVNQAIDECEMFNQQGSDDCAGQADAVVRVRDDASPDKRELITHVPHLRNMRARFPAWTSIIASRDRIAQWDLLEKALPAWRRRLRLTRSSSRTESSGSSNWWIVVVVIMVVRLLASLGSPSTSAPSPSFTAPPLVAQPQGPASEKERNEEILYQRAARNLYIPPATPRYGELPPLPPPRRFLNEAELKAISKRVRFAHSAGDEGQYRVDFSVDIDEQGKIRTLTKTSGSGLAALDASVEKAIRASAPFGPEINRSFKLNYKYEFVPAKKIPPQDAGDGRP